MFKSGDLDVPTEAKLQVLSKGHQNNNQCVETIHMTNERYADRIIFRGITRCSLERKTSGYLHVISTILVRQHLKNLNNSLSDLFHVNEIYL